MTNYQVGKTGKSVATRKKIVSNYTSMVSEQPWDKISVKALCDKCDITRGTFYQYFEDIYELVNILELDLIEDLSVRFHQLPDMPSISAVITVENFDTTFNFEPHPEYQAWVDFCFDNQDILMAICHPTNGDTYFLKRLQSVLFPQFDIMMTRDGFPNDDYRELFRPILFELHLNVISHWFTIGSMDMLSRSSIPSILNTARIGACYNFYKFGSCPTPK